MHPLNKATKILSFGTTGNVTQETVWDLESLMAEIQEYMSLETLQLVYPWIARAHTGDTREFQVVMWLLIEELISKWKEFGRPRSEYEWNTEVMERSKPGPTALGDIWSLCLSKIEDMNVTRCYVRIEHLAGYPGFRLHTSSRSAGLSLPADEDLLDEVKMSSPNRNDIILRFAVKMMYWIYREGFLDCDKRTLLLVVNDLLASDYFRMEEEGYGD